MKLQNIKKGDFIKRYTNIYLVKSFRHNEREYTIEYFFRISTKTKNPKLHSNGVDKNYSYDLAWDRVKNPTDEEVEQLREMIKQECPKFNFETLSYKESKNNSTVLTIDKCIDFLKKEGYIVLKQV